VFGRVQTFRFPERETLQMTSPAEYRRRARHLLQMAQTCQDSQIAARLIILTARQKVTVRRSNSSNKSSLIRMPSKGPLSRHDFRIRECPLLRKSRHSERERRAIPPRLVPIRLIVRSFGRQGTRVHLLLAGDLSQRPMAGAASFDLV
jgi:hypothetical protein